MISAVLDANTLVSAILVELGISRQILRAAYERRFICLCSAAIVAEVLRAFNRPRVRRRYTIDPNEVEELRRFLESELVAVAITVNVHGVATHPEDDLMPPPYLRMLTIWSPAIGSFKHSGAFKVSQL